MRLAVVAQPFDPFPARKASLAIWAQELADRLSARHDVTICSRELPDRPADETLDGVRHLRFPIAADAAVAHRVRRVERIASRLAGRPVDLYHRHYYFAPRFHRHYAAAVAEGVAAIGAETIVIVNFPQFVPILRRRNPDARIVLVMQCDWLVEMPRRQVARALRDVDAICGCSRYIADGVARRFPEYAARCHTLYNGTNPDRFRRPPDTELEARRRELGLEGRRIVTYVGRVTPEKGVHTLLEAMPRVARAVPEATLLIVGSFSVNPPSPRWFRRRERTPLEARFEAMKPTYRETVEALAARVGDAARVLGSVPHDALPALYALSEVFVHPSIWNEPFGMILTEAMGCSKPVLSTPTGGIPEIVVDGETGRLVSPDSPEALATALEELLGDAEVRERFGEAGRRRLLERFTWDHTANALQDVLRSLEARGA